LSQCWSHFSHDADMGVRGQGETLEQAFEQAGVALTAVICNPDTLSPQTRVEIHCEAPDIELLFVDWLNDLIYQMATRKLLFGRFKVQISDQQLLGQAWGEPVDASKHAPAVEIKGATYTALSVSKVQGNGWIAQCVVDV